jgi:hypothetical protein
METYCREPRGQRAPVGASRTKRLLPTEFDQRDFQQVIDGKAEIGIGRVSLRLGSSVQAAGVHQRRASLLAIEQCQDRPANGRGERGPGRDDMGEIGRERG